MLTAGLGLGCLAQCFKPTPRENKPRKRNPLLKEEPRHEINRPAEGFRRHGLQPVATTLERDCREGAPKSDGEKRDGQLRDCSNENNCSEQE